MEKETKRGNGIQEAKSSILFISTRISAACVNRRLFSYIGATSRLIQPSLLGGCCSGAVVKACDAT